MGSSGLHTPAYRLLCSILRRWREEAGATQRELAERLGRPHSYVHKCEAGERRVDPLEFIAWCEACGRDPAKAIAQVRREVLA